MTIISRKNEGKKSSALNGLGKWLSIRVPMFCGGGNSQPCSRTSFLKTMIRNAAWGALVLLYKPPPPPLPLSGSHAGN
jgi:hypothetical protein